MAMAPVDSRRKWTRYVVEGLQAHVDDVEHAIVDLSVVAVRLIRPEPLSAADLGDAAGRSHRLLIRSTALAAVRFRLEVPATVIRAEASFLVLGFDPQPLQMEQKLRRLDSRFSMALTDLFAE